ncbi:MAG: 2-C-methyl-D-erythritol 4-phosphate cytidylyltransferase [Pseudomonadota bacterium]
MTSPQPDDTKLIAIVPAAGTGSRMQAAVPKQYLSLCGKSILERVIEALLGFPRIDRVVVGIANGDEHWAGLPISKNPRVLIAEGGEVRAQTVQNCLDTIDKHDCSEHWVMVQDAVRPLINNEMLERLFQSAIETDSGALLALPAVDTIKCAQANSEVGIEPRVQNTLDRDTIWAAQTPQMFPAQKLRSALIQARSNKKPITDESSAMEYAGFNPRLVKGSSLNIKITQPGDLKIAEAFYQTMNRN